MAYKIESVIKIHCIWENEIKCLVLFFRQEPKSFFFSGTFEFCCNGCMYAFLWIEGFILYCRFLLHVDELFFLQSLSYLSEKHTRRNMWRNFHVHLCSSSVCLWDTSTRHLCLPVNCIRSVSAITSCSLLLKFCVLAFHVFLHLIKPSLYLYTVHRHELSLADVYSQNL